MGVGLRYPAASGAEESDRAGGGGRSIGQRHRPQPGGESQDGDAVARALCATGAGRYVGSGWGTGPQAKLWAAQDRGDRVGDPWQQAEGYDAVELSGAGRGPRGEQVDHPQYLARSPSAAASGQDIQAV